MFLVSLAHLYAFSHKPYRFEAEARKEERPILPLVVKVRTLLNTSDVVEDVKQTFGHRRLVNYDDDDHNTLLLPTVTQSDYAINNSSADVASINVCMCVCLCFRLSWRCIRPRRMVVHINTDSLHLSDIVCVCVRECVCCWLYFFYPIYMRVFIQISWHYSHWYFKLSVLHSECVCVCVSILISISQC